MNNDGYQVHIERDPMRNITRVYIYQQLPNGRRTFLEATEIVEHVIEEGQEPKPTLLLPTTTANEVFRALAETLDAKQIKTDKDARIEGTLESTRFHLEDLRHLLKLPKGGK